MTRVVFYTATTLNGFLATDDHSLDWLFAVPGAAEAEEGIDGFFAEMGVLVEGSATYEWILEHDGLLEHPEKWAEFYGDRPTWVFTSRSLPAVAGADIRFVSGDVTEHWDAIRTAAGERAVWLVGGGDLVGQFDDAGLLTEIQVSIAPATLGSGKPLLPRSIGPERLHLEKVSRTGQFAELTYSVSPRS